MQEPAALVERRQRPRRTREEIVRDLKFALGVGDGRLPEEGQRARGSDPYDSQPEQPQRDVWRSRRRG